MSTRTTYQPQPARGAVSNARPLYLLPSSDASVVLDGPALCVGVDERADQTFPLARVSRVYSATDVSWSTEALLACADAGIGVLFLDRDGAVRARVLGRPGERDELYQRLTEFLLLPEAMGRYRHWLTSMRTRAAHWAGLKLGAPPVLHSPSTCRQWIEHRAAQLVGRNPAQRNRQWLRALAYGWMQAHLHDLGFGRTTELAQIDEPDLARDLTDILAWYLEVARIGWLQRRKLAAERNGEFVQPPGRAAVVRLFEHRQTRTAARGREISSALHRWLIHET